MSATALRHTADLVYPNVAKLGAQLGDAADPAVTFSRVACAALDEREEFPAEICDLLDRLDVSAHYVPVRYGGAWRDHDELVQLVRELSRRDLTVAVAHAKTFLGAVCVWIAGDPEQARRLAVDVLTGVPVAWGLTERAHGSDLLSTAMTAEPASGGYRLTGEKWPINNATRGGLICVLARTGQDPGARGLSLLLVDKRRLPDDSWRCLPKVLTHGIRGADISGIVFTDAPVPGVALVGSSGRGLETVLRALQLTRIMCIGLSLGAADHALGLVLEYVSDRFLYERNLVDMPHVRRSLGEQCALALLAETVSLMAARTAHTVPSELPVVSALVKAFVPAAVDQIIAGCAELLGARAFLNGVYADGAFQKLERDHRIVSIFDGNTAVNRNAVINHFPVLVRGWQAGPSTSDVEQAVRRAATLGQALPEIGELSLSSRTGCAVIQQLPAAVTRLQEDLRPLGVALVCITTRLHEQLAQQRPSVRAVPAESFELVEQYEWCFAAASAIHIWLANHEHRNGAPDPAAAWWREGLWLRAVLTLALDRLGEPLPGTAPAVFDELIRVLTTAGTPSVLATVDRERQGSWIPR